MFCQCFFSTNQASSGEFEITEVVQSYERRLQEQVALAKLDILANLESQIQVECIFFLFVAATAVVFFFCFSQLLFFLIFSNLFL